MTPAQRESCQELTLRTKKYLLTFLILGGGFLLALFFFKKDSPPQIAELAVEPVIEKKSSAPTVLINQTWAEANAPVPQVAQEPPASPNKIISLEKFMAMAKSAMKTLPKQVPIEGLTEEEAHHPSAKMLQTLDPFIDIVQAVADNPQLETAAFTFYEKCATDNKANLATTLRSRCLSHMRRLQDKLGKRSEVERVTPGLDPAIVRLADAID